MTTITIKRALLEEVVEIFDNSISTRYPHQILSDIRAVLAAPATASEFPTNWAQMIHYPECWDTAAYPELRDAIHEALAWSGCSVCKPANAPTQPAWHDAPTCAGVWVNSISGRVNVVIEETLSAWQHSGARYYGPIPSDSGDRP